MPPRLFRRAAVVTLASVLALPAAAQTATTAFPGGASALSETHGDWTLVCGLEEDARVCVLTQSLASGSSGQRVLTVELEPAAEGAIAGSLMLPFGLLLADGVRTQVDAVTIGDTIAFSACYDNGCLADFTLDAPAADLLRRGGSLRLLATVADSGENVTLTVSLAGVSSALDRARALTE